jgi:hypothetical protein
VEAAYWYPFLTRRSRPPRRHCPIIGLAVPYLDCTTSGHGGGEAQICNLRYELGSPTHGVLAQRALQFGHSGAVNPEGCQRVAGGRSGQRGNDHRKSASDGLAPRRGVPAQFSGATPISNPRGSNDSGTLSGVQNPSCAVARRSPSPKTLGDLRLPSGKPFGFLIQNVHTSGRAVPALPGVWAFYPLKRRPTRRVGRR